MSFKLSDLKDILWALDKSHAVKVRDAQAWVMDAMYGRIEELEGKKEPEKEEEPKKKVTKKKVASNDGKQTGNKVQRKNKAASKKASKNMARKNTASRDSRDA